MAQERKRNRRQRRAEAATQPPPPSGRTLEIFSDPDHMRGDLQMANMIARRQGLRSRVIEAAYAAAEEALSDKQLSKHTKIRALPGIAAIIKADVDAERFETGRDETSINITQQTAVTVNDQGTSEEERTADDIASMAASILPPSAVYQHIGLQISRNGEANHSHESEPE